MSDIKNFEDIIEQHNLSRDTLTGIRDRLAQSMGMKLGTDSFNSWQKKPFTGLQDKAFNTKGFWLSDHAEDRHIIVQGSTSSGKTLISEMAILDSLKYGNDFESKSIVLVPLRAMVRERWKQLRRDLEKQGIDKVYASSSDYLDHDGEIIKGYYKVAVIVYEKFFAMLSQPDSKMMENCKLLVVDELQMLGKRDRGPKLEIALQKVLRTTRIMCLTTSDCKVGFIKKWLTMDGKEPVPIINNKRPTSLLETVIQTDGKYRALPIYGEDGITKIEPYGEYKEVRNIDGKFINYEGAIEVPEHINAKGNKTDAQNKNALLKALLKEIYGRNPAAKVLIFVNGRLQTQKLAEYIAGHMADENILPERDESDEEYREMLSEIGKFDNDENAKLLINKLLPRRIACHSAAMSTALREFVEEKFGSSNDLVRLVVATETLTIGMNMPVDVMILYDDKVPRRKETETELQSLTSQEYKNFVGRAGRLGQENIRGGRSFIFAIDKDKGQHFWNDYVNCTPEEITSSLTSIEEKDLAPYYLNLLNTPKYAKRGYTTENLNELWKESFSRACGKQSKNMQTMCDTLNKAKFCWSQDGDDEEEELERYKLSDLGKSLAPYALSIETCKLIRQVFFDGGYIKKKGKLLLKKGGGLPNVTAKELEPEGYLLDILYALCGTEEVSRLGQLQLTESKKPDKLLAAKTCVEKTLKKMYAAKLFKCWKNSPLESIIKDDDKNYDLSNDDEGKQRLMRAIILWHWTRGDRIEKIRNETNFKIPWVVGDIARFAETVAYQLEAISHANYRSTVPEFRDRDLSGLYRLSTRVNYGVPQELISIANKNVPKLERNMILDAGDFFEKHTDKYESALSMLRAPKSEDLEAIRKIIDDEMRKELVRLADESGEHEDIENLLDHITRDGIDLSEGAKDALKRLHDGQLREDEKYLLPCLNDIFYNSRSTENHIFDESIRLKFPIKDQNFAALECNGKSIFLIAQTDEFNEDYAYQIEQGGDGFKIILLTTDFGDKFNEVRREYEKLEGAGKKLLAMEFKTLAWLIAHAIWLSDFKGLMLMALLRDACGKLDPPLRNLHLLLQNYMRQETERVDDKAVRLLCDGRKSKALEELKEVLKENRIAYRELSWGGQLKEECKPDKINEPTLLFLNSATAQSFESLDGFCGGLERINYHQTYAIFESKDESERWAPNLKHCDSTQNFKTDIGVEFKNWLSGLNERKEETPLIGISYARKKKFKDERAAVQLLKKFVERLNREFGEQKIFFDDNPSWRHYFNGIGAQNETLAKYDECKYIVILDDPDYDNSENCHSECESVKRRLSARSDNERWLWLLHPKGEDHCAFYWEFKNNYGGFDSLITKNNVEQKAQEFIQTVKQSLNGQ